MSNDRGPKSYGDDKGARIFDEVLVPILLVNPNERITFITFWNDLGATGYNFSRQHKIAWLCYRKNFGVRCLQDDVMLHREVIGEANQAIGAILYPPRLQAQA